MFYLLAIGSMLFYALQNTLLVHYARRIDGLSLSLYRGASFIITLSPLLIGSSSSEILSVLTHWRLLMLSGLSGGLFLALNFESLRFIPVGLAQTTTRSLSTILMALAGWFLFHDPFSLTGLGLILLIIGGCLWLGMQRPQGKHGIKQPLPGILLALASALPLAVTHAVLASISKQSDPLTSGYLWEVSIGLGSATLIVLRSLTTRKHIQRIPRRTFLLIAACASPTLIGTGLYSLALRAGPLSIASAIGGGSLVVMSLLAWWWYGERLHAMQWTAIAVVLAGIVGLKFI